MLTINVTPGWQFPVGVPVDLSALRMGANPTIELSGVVEAGDVEDGAIQPQHLSPAGFLVATTSGSGAAYVAVSLNNTAIAIENAWVWVIPHADSTGACTLNLDGLGAKAILMPNGANPLVAALRANTPALVMFNTTLDAWVLSSLPANGLPMPLKGSVTIPELTISSATVMQVVADSAILTDSSTGAYSLWEEVSETASLGATGAGGIDVGGGVPASDTTYYVYLVSDGTDLALMLSTSGSAPSNANFAWTSKVLVGKAFYDATTDNTFEDVWCDWPTPRYVSALIAGGTADNTITLTHNLGRKPKAIRVELECVATSATYATNFAVGDIIDARDAEIGAHTTYNTAPVEVRIPAGGATTAVECMCHPAETWSVVDPTSAGTATCAMYNGGNDYWKFRVIIET